MKSGFPSGSAQKHMLDGEAEQNIGNGNIIYPQAGNATVIPQTNPERILMLSGPSSAGQTTSVALTASRIVGPQNPNPGYPGPITGIIEFGNGGQFTRVEVDIPVGPFSGSIVQANNAVEPQDGGIIITVPTGVMRIYARYDNLLIQPSISNILHPAQSIAQTNGVSFIGPGGPVFLPHPPPNNIIPAEPVLVKAMAAYFSRHTSKVYRTHYCYVGDGSTGIITPVSLDPFYGRFMFCIPAFARSLKVLRNGPNGVIPNLNVALSDNMNHTLDFIQIPSSASSPIIPLTGTETLVEVLSTNFHTDLVTLLALSYEIGI